MTTSVHDFRAQGSCTSSIQMTTSVHDFRAQGSRTSSIQMTTSVHDFRAQESQFSMFLSNFTEVVLKVKVCIIMMKLMTILHGKQSSTWEKFILLLLVETFIVLEYMTVQTYL